MATLEQSRVELLFELLYLLFLRRLGHEQRLRGTRETQMPGDGMEHLQASVSHKHRLSVHLMRLLNHK